MPETRATTAGPDRFEQHLVAGSELLRRDQVAEARAELEAALELRPTDLKALGLFGLACFRQNAFDDALPVYQRMVELRPDDASHRLNLGLVYLKVGQAERAVHELGRSRALDPSQQRTVSYLGLAHARRGDYGDAYEAFLRAGQEQLALEMAQYLSREEAEAIRARSEFEEEGVITKAVALALPAAPVAATGARVGMGQEAPCPLTELATRRLIRPEDGDHPFEIGPGGALIVRVRGRILSRIEDVIVLYGDLRFEPATRHVRGADTGEVFGEGERPISVVAGQGYLVVAPAGHCFTAVALDDDILYLRESLVYAFEDQLRWENGRVPGSGGEPRTVLRVVQFRGHGCVALRSKRPLLSLKLASDRPVRIDAGVLAGWIGRVVPRLVGAEVGRGARAAFVECSGEGVVLLDDQGDA